jgi:outer membrane protein OmpA-like peptidoglycan-associated protein
VGVRAAGGKLVIGPEVTARTVVSNPDAFFTSLSTPVEGLFGAHVMAVRDLRFGVGAGAGLTRGAGAAQFRAVANLEWAPTLDDPRPVPPPPDYDHDGIPDTVDACPRRPGPPSRDPRKHGCPPPPDRDADGIVDAVDACPDVPGLASEDPAKNGCPPPPPDEDGDGIPDATDACPKVKGVRTDDPKTNGCPPDGDGDGILDAEDACPLRPGPRHPDPKRNGCPIVEIQGEQIRIAEQVKFKTGSAEILGESDEILGAVAQILKDTPSVVRVRVEGHTDSRGARAYNQELSQARARSVVKWLLAHGIEATRLAAAGVGPDRSIDDNATEEGRRNNRRVEFHILETKAEPSAPSP